MTVYDKAVTVNNKNTFQYKALLEVWIVAFSLFTPTTTGMLIYMLFQIKISISRNICILTINLHRKYYGKRNLNLTV